MFKALCELRKCYDAVIRHHVQLPHFELIIATQPLRELVFGRCTLLQVTGSDDDLRCPQGCKLVRGFLPKSCCCSSNDDDSAIVALSRGLGRRDPFVSDHANEFRHCWRMW